MFNSFSKKNSNSQEATEHREKYYEQMFGPMSNDMYHSTDNKSPHIDIYQFGPHGDRDYWTLITAGMSDAKQFIPKGMPFEIAPRAEILMYVKEPQTWMFNVLKTLSEMPFDKKTFLHWWHTIAYGMPMTDEPSLLTGFFLLPPYFEPEGFNNLTIDGDKVDFIWLVPITDLEMEYKAKYGGAALDDLLRDARISPIVDEGRKSIIDAVE